MHTSRFTTLVLLSATSAMAAPHALDSRQAQPCFVVGNTALPEEVSDAAAAIQSTITCDAAKTTLNGVPDVTSGATSFSSIDFSQAASPLQFALDTFATKTPLADTDLQTFQDSLDVYIATEAGIRSVDGNFASIKIPKFFLSMQVSRIMTAQGNPPTAPGLQVDHLRDKVTKNAPKESKALLDQVVALAAATT